MTTLPSAISISPESNLQRYLQEIRRFPMLEKEQEYMLAKRWLEHNDTNSAHQMVQVIFAWFRRLLPVIVAMVSRSPN